MSSGTLYVVATPIGNLSDLAPRAAEVLRTVDLVAAEDTRRTRKLLSHLGVSTRLESFHEHSDPKKLERLVASLVSGLEMALVSDAGTPVLSDPGVELVRAARHEGVPVIAVPGPSAVSAALSVSGLPADRFLFLGFLPRKGTERTRIMEEIASSEHTVVLFESPRRLNRTLSDLEQSIGPDREAVVVRELTKVHEETRAGTLSDLTVYYQSADVRGEITIVLAGVPPSHAPADPSEVARRARELLDDGLSRRDVAARLAAEMNLPRNDVYRIVTDL